MTIRDRRDNTGDITQGNRAHRRAPGLVKGASQTRTKHDERIRAPRKRGEDPGTGHGLVVEESLGEARVNAHRSPSSAPCAYVREASFSCARTRPALVTQ